MRIVFILLLSALSSLAGSGPASALSDVTRGGVRAPIISEEIGSLDREIFQIAQKQRRERVLEKKRWQREKRRERRRNDAARRNADSKFAQRWQRKDSGPKDGTRVPARSLSGVIKSQSRFRDSRITNVFVRRPARTKSGFMYEVWVRSRDGSETLVYVDPDTRRILYEAPGRR